MRIWRRQGSKSDERDFQQFRRPPGDDKLEASGFAIGVCLLLPILGVRKLDPMSAFRKIGISIMAFLLFGMPLLNCVTPVQAMTAAEKECCKKMAAECG
jgi:hypothetical protein